MTVSLCVIAYNEERLIRGLLDDISKQTYPHKLTEIVFVNNGSTDTTEELFSSFANINSDFLRVCIRSQERSNQAAGWNTAISNAMGDIIIRIDAHARIPHNYISVCCISTAADSSRLERWRMRLRIFLVMFSGWKLGLTMP